MGNGAMEERLAELEIRVSFQDKTLQDLNDVVIRQQAELDRVIRELQALKARVKGMAVSDIAMEAEDSTPPPHY